MKEGAITAPFFSARPIGVALHRFLPLLGALAAFVVFGLLSAQIDFHPDETIYFDAIPLSLRNDSGLFYSLLYQIPLPGLDGPAAARLISALLGAGAIGFLLAALRALGASDRRLLFGFVVLVCSYQAVFIFDRVRPEAAWWFLTAMAVWGLAELERGPSRFVQGLLLLACFLLPMNHRLSWFPAAFIGLYALLHLLPRRSASLAISLACALGMGALANIFVRGYLLDVSAGEALRAALDAPHSTMPSLKAFARNVFIDAPLFLTDRAESPSFYTQLLPEGSRLLRFLNHSFVQNALWLSMLVWPVLGRTRFERCALSFPLFAYAAFQLSGYYNPTYAAGFSLACVFTALALLGTPSKKARALALVVLSLSLFNGLSFYATRLLNHGPATYFALEAQLAERLANDPKLKTVMLPERFQSATRHFKGHRLINYKDVMPKHLDLLVLDSYDDVMYQFVENFEAKKTAFHAATKTYCRESQVRLPIYEDDALFPEAAAYLDGQSDSPLPGSWFFRHSAAYGLTLYRPCS